MSNTNNPSPPAATPPQGERDPLASLHKMSRTAGVGSQEYVEVNVTAVVTLLLGLLSILAVLLGPLFLFIPVVALAVGMIAIKQVRDSAGTQTGIPVALLGMAIGVGFVAYVGGQAYRQSREVAAEQDAVVSLIRSLGENLKAGRYDAAYAQFATGFQSKVKPTDFADFWTRAQASPVFGRIQSMDWNTILSVQIDPETNTKIARGVVLVKLEKSNEPERLNSVFRKTDEGWKVDDLGMNIAGFTTAENADSNEQAQQPQ